MPITITAFADSPDEGQGMARDMPVRWALEEAGHRYDVRLLTFAEMKEAPHRTLHPFGQIPTFEDGDVAIFESAAIVLAIAERSDALLPRDPAARLRAIAWMFAAQSTVEPPIVEREAMMLLEHDRPWFAERLPIVDARIHNRLDDLSTRLGDADWLDGAFSAGDLMMISALRRLDGWNMLERYANLTAYVARGMARPAFERAFAAQRAVFDAKSAPREPQA